MLVNLTHSEIQVLLTALDYSKDRVRNAPGTPASVRQESLVRLDSVAAKLRAAQGQGIPHQEV